MRNITYQIVDRKFSIKNRKQTHRCLHSAFLRSFRSLIRAITFQSKRITERKTEINRDTKYLFPLQLKWLWIKKRENSKKLSSTPNFWRFRHLRPVDINFGWWNSYWIFVKYYLVYSCQWNVMIVHFVKKTWVRNTDFIAQNNGRMNYNFHMNNEFIVYFQKIDDENFGYFEETNYAVWRTILFGNMDCWSNRQF